MCVLSDVFCLFFFFILMSLVGYVLWMWLFLGICYPICHVADNNLIFYNYFSQKLKLDIACVSSARRIIHMKILTLLLLNMTCPVLANSVDPDQLASEEANWSGFALFVIKYVNFYQKPGSSNLIGWKLEVGVAS